jgi:hypothetical protein
LGCGIHAKAEKQELAQKIQCTVSRMRSRSRENIEELIKGTIRDVVEDSIRIKYWEGKDLGCQLSES